MNILTLILLTTLPARAGAILSKPMQGLDPKKVEKLAQVSEGPVKMAKGCPKDYLQKYPELDYANKDSDWRKWQQASQDLADAANRYDKACSAFTGHEQSSDVVKEIGASGEALREGSEGFKAATDKLSDDLEKTRKEMHDAITKKDYSFFHVLFLGMTETWLRGMYQCDFQIQGKQPKVKETYKAFNSKVEDLIGKCTMRQNAKK